MYLEAKGGWSGKTCWVGFSQGSTTEFRKAMGMERLAQLVQSTAIPYSETFTQVPRLPDGKKKYLLGDSQASGDMVPAA